MPNYKKRQVSFHLEPSVHDLIKTQAKLRGLTNSEVVTRAVKQASDPVPTVQPYNLLEDLLERLQAPFK